MSSFDSNTPPLSGELPSRRLSSYSCIVLENRKIVREGQTWVGNYMSLEITHPRPLLPFFLILDRSVSWCISPSARAWRTTTRRVEGRAGTAGLAAAWFFIGRRTSRDRRHYPVKTRGASPSPRCTKWLPTVRCGVGIGRDGTAHQC